MSAHHACVNGLVVGCPEYLQHPLGRDLAAHPQEHGEAVLEKVCAVLLQPLVRWAHCLRKPSFVCKADFKALIGAVANGLTVKHVVNGQQARVEEREHVLSVEVLQVLEVVHTLIDCDVPAFGKREDSMTMTSHDVPARKRRLLIMEPVYTGRSLRHSGRMSCNGFLQSRSKTQKHNANLP